jgi:hypothetical protein
LSNHPPSEFKALPKLFQNLGSTRATELAAEFPGCVAAEWLGHRTAIANKHYWRVTDADFEKAVPEAQHKAQKNVSDDGGMDRQRSEQKCEKPADYEIAGFRWCLQCSLLESNQQPID